MKHKINLKLMLVTLFMFSALATGTVAVIHVHGDGDEDRPQEVASGEVPDHSDVTGQGSVRQDPTTTPAPDNAIFAAETGLPLERIDKALEFQDAFAEYAEALMDEFPAQISAVWMDSAPGPTGPSTRGHIRFTEKVPESLTDMANVEVTGGGLISIEDQWRRAEIAAEVLADLGYTDFATFFSPSENTINLELLLPAGASEPGKLDLVTAMQQHIQAGQEFRGRANQVVETDVALTILRGSGPFMIHHHSRGGNSLPDGNAGRCTSGWSVSSILGDAILTAGHCVGLDKVEQPGLTPYNMTYRDGHVGADGDVEYHTTSHIELAEFYATASSIRDVTGIRGTASMVGANTCFYGRSSNNRTCSIEVEAVNVSIAAEDGTTVGSLARTEDSPSIPGDSGGGWSTNYKAWGVHSAKDGSGRGYFTPIEEAEAVLNVTIKTQ